MISLFYSLISFYYVPPSYFDKAHYIVFYNEYLGLDLSSFLFEITTKKNDFIFYCIMYLGAVVKLNFHFTMAFITFCTSYFIYDAFYKFVRDYKASTKCFSIFFLLITLSISLGYFFSGMRFYLAGALLLQSIYFLHKGKYKMVALYFILASLTHFGVLTFLPLLITYMLFRGKPKFLKFLFFCSFSLLFVNRDFILSLSEIGILGSFLQDKIYIYLGENDFVEDQLASGSIYYEIKFVLTYALHALILVFLSFNIRRNDNIFLITLMCLVVANIFSSAPFMFFRITLIINSLVFILLMFVSRHTKTNYKFNSLIFSLVFSLMLVLFSLDLILISPSFKNHSNFLDFFTFFSIFLEDIPQYPSPT